MWALVWTVFAASVVGSLHCAGMCGGLVAFAVGAPPPDHKARHTFALHTQPGAPMQTDWYARCARWLAANLGAHIAYHGGRLLAYATLGAVAGLLGHGVDLAGETRGWSQTAVMMAGAAMVAWGFWSLLSASGVRMPTVPRSPVLTALYGATVRNLRAQPASVRAAVLGLASALLPCGWLYAFVVTAAGTGSALGGATAMLAFWAGTLPMLTALGAGVQSLAGPLRRHVPKFAAATLVVVGVLAIAQRAQPLVAADVHACCHDR